MTTTKNLANNNIEASLQAQVQRAFAEKAPLTIRGSGSKDFYGEAVRTKKILEISQHQGIVTYDPTELSITLRAGTPLADIEALLDTHQQRLPFEPPHFAETSTIGGVIAAGLSGPRRPYAGAVRDAVLGVKILNGKGQILSFGGQVMKNVAGYDVSRLMAGSLGILGVILEVSLRVIPHARGKMTLVHDNVSMRSAQQTMRRWARQSLPITATAWYDGQLYTRICGSHLALASAHQIIGGEKLNAAPEFWASLRDHSHEFFQEDAPLWRLSVAPTAQVNDNQNQLMEWGGGLRWIKQEESAADDLRNWARCNGGHATLFRSFHSNPQQSASIRRFQKPNSIVLKLHQRLKQAFDPAGILNPGRMFPES
jgi:glycolate oxidase FAD binding subunit